MIKWMRLSWCPKFPSPYFCFQSTEQNSFVYQTVSSPCIRFMEQEASTSLGASLPLVNLTRQDGSGIQCSDKERKQVWDRVKLPDKGRRGQRFSQLLCHQPTVFQIYLSVLVQSWHTQEGLPPNWSSRRSPVFSYWLLCLTANSNSQ